MAIVLYARKSVERENSISCETQLKYCKSMLKPDEQDKKIISIVDNGYSGGNINRDGFQKMMKLIHQNKISKVIVYKVDRISRSLSDFINIIDDFKTHHVEFISSQESFDTSSPYGELIIKILMVFAEFERNSIIERVTQAYAHRSEMGLYMGGRQPYGFELTPMIINNIKTKKLNGIPDQIEQIQYIFNVYAKENISLRRLLNILSDEGKMPLNGSEWTTAKLSSILKNPIYVKADADVYDYYDKHGVQMISDISAFKGIFGAQLYGKTKHKQDSRDWSDMKLVIMPHNGVIDSDIWLKCQHKLSHNKQIHKSMSNKTSWLAGKIFCEKCGHTMTTIKGNINRSGVFHRYFYCTGKTNKLKCKGPDLTIFAEDLENLIFRCITQKLSELKETKISTAKINSTEINELKLRIKEIEKQEEILAENLLEGKLEGALLKIANNKAISLNTEKRTLLNQAESIRKKDSGIIINPVRLWKKADYSRKKAVTYVMIHKIIISENGDIKIIWKV